MDKEYEIEIAVSDRKTGKFLGLVLIMVYTSNQREAIELGLSRAAALMNSSVKFECNGVTEL